MATIFTKIIRGEIPCYKIAENSTHIAFLDISPVSEGHTLVVPKQEIDYLFELPDSLLAESVIFAKKVATALDRTLKPLRTGVVVEGLEVPHAHIHLVPIYREGQGLSLRSKAEVSQERMQQIAEIVSAGVEL
ncbi:MAG: HIT family protein [Balneolaceae bacterium]|nr:MAG: HIT family protein [Balneolaceae bacterium]